MLSAAHHAWEVELERESEAPQGPYDGVVGVGIDPERWPFSASQLVALGHGLDTHIDFEPVVNDQRKK